MTANSSLGALLLLAVSAADAADLWGCEVLLCMANPAGPTAAPSCRDPIERLWAHLRRGRPWPSCDEAGERHSITGARMGSNYFESCPAGMSALGEGERAVLLGRDGRVGAYAIGIGDGEDVNPYRGTGTLAKTCVAEPRGGVLLAEGDSSVSATVYGRMVQLAPGASAAYIDLTQGGESRRVRY